MNCKNCGAEVAEGSAFCSACGAKIPKEKKRPIAPVRLLMQLGSFVLCLVLLVSLVGTVALADVRLLTSSGSIETILNHLLNPQSPTPSADAAVGAAGVIIRRDISSDFGFTVDQDGNIIDDNGNIIGNINDPDSIQLPEGIELPDDLQIPADALTDSNALAEFVYEIAQEMLGEELPITVEQVQAFLEESNVMEFVAEKASGLIEEVLSGELSEAPIITTDELVQLVQENIPVIEKHFEVEITEEMRQEFTKQIQASFDDAALNETLRETVNETLSQPISIGGAEEMTVSELLATINQYTQPKTIFLAVCGCLVLMALVMLLNFYNLPQGMRWNAGPCIWAGLALSLPLMLLQSAVAEELAAEVPALQGILTGVVKVIAPVHYGVLALGVVLFVGSFFLNALLKKR